MHTYIQFNKFLDYETILEHTKKRIAINAEQLRITAIVLACLEKFYGKQISKRLETAVKKELPDYSVCYSFEFGMFHLKIWKQQLRNEDVILNYDNAVRLLLGYGTNPFFEKEKIAGYFRCYLLNAERNEKLYNGIASIKTLCERWNAGLKELKAINKEAENFELEYTFELDRN